MHRIFQNFYFITWYLAHGCQFSFVKVSYTPHKRTLIFMIAEEKREAGTERKNRRRHTEKDRQRVGESHAIRG